MKLPADAFLNYSIDHLYQLACLILELLKADWRQQDILMGCVNAKIEEHRRNPSYTLAQIRRELIEAYKDITHIAECHEQMLFDQQADEEGLFVYSMRFAHHLEKLNDACSQYLGECDSAVLIFTESVAMESYKVGIQLTHVPELEEVLRCHYDNLAATIDRALEIELIYAPDFIDR